MFAFNPKCLYSKKNIFSIKNLIQDIFLFVHQCAINCVMVSNKKSGL